MSALEREIHIDAPPEHVYAVVTDPTCLERWVTIQDALEEAPDGDLEPGSRLVQRLKLAGRRFHVTWIVKQATPPTRIVWEGTGPMGTKATAIYELSANNGGTTFSYENNYRLPGGPAGRVVGRALAAASGREADRSLERLKRLIEGG